MTNAEKFKTAKERRKEYEKYCKHKVSQNLPMFDILDWLESEYEEELKPCPFCGDEARVIECFHEGSEYYWIECKECYGRTTGSLSKDDAIAAWNRRVR